MLDAVPYFNVEVFVQVSIETCSAAFIFYGDKRLIRLSKILYVM